MPNKIWHPNDINSASWFNAGVGNPHNNWTPVTIPNAGTAEFLNLPESIKNILKLDKPDLIATIEIDNIDVPVVSIEITTTTPQSQHAKQRVPRLIAAAESEVPSIYIIPEKKRNNDKKGKKGSIYRLGDDLFMGIDRIQDINKIPVFAYAYPDTDGRLDHDAKFPNQPNLKAQSIKNAFKTIDIVIENKIKLKPVTALYSDKWIIDEIVRHKKRASYANVIVDNYKTLTEIPTSDLVDFCEDNTHMNKKHIMGTLNKLPNRIQARHSTIIFRPEGRLFDHANDPYSGMLAFFDYAFCRTGPNIEDRNTNLIYMPMNDTIFNITDEFAPKGYHRYWENSCPFKSQDVPKIEEQFKISHHLQYGCVYSKIKPLRILGYFSDMIIFQDSMLVF